MTEKIGKKEIALTSYLRCLKKKVREINISNMFHSYKEQRNGQKSAALVAIIVITEKNRFLCQNLDEKWSFYGGFA